jgi:hypothetical protein
LIFAVICLPSLRCDECQGAPPETSTAVSAGIADEGPV